MKSSKPYGLGVRIKRICSVESAYKIRNTPTFTYFEGKTFNVDNYINCTTANVVYALFCKHCDKFIYVGETRDTLYQRHLLNLSLIGRQKPDPIAIHFNSTEHSVNDYEIVALEKNCGDNSYRETIEKNCG
jgi:hypothetical protein